MSYIYFLTFLCFLLMDFGGHLCLILITCRPLQNSNVRENMSMHVHVNSVQHIETNIMYQVLGLEGTYIYMMIPIFYHFAVYV